jgi:hypothetical protein
MGYAERLGVPNLVSGKERSRIKDLELALCGHPSPGGGFVEGWPVERQSDCC